MSGANQVFIAVDLGASSGRLVAGHFNGAEMKLEEVHRFANGRVRAAGRMYWDLLHLWQEIKGGLRIAGERFGDSVVSVGVDTWGVDFGLLGADDQLLGNPLHYRDPHTEQAMDLAFSVVPRAEIFSETGLQFLPFNTLYQWLAMKKAHSAVLNAADHFLMMPDLFHWLMTGVKINEQTNASTTQFYNPQTGDWSRGLLQRFGLPYELLHEIAEPGTVLGPLRPEVAESSGLHNVRVVLPGTHDTASAVMAVPAADSNGGMPDWCYISSGTWSLMGVEVPKPIISDRVRELNFTNEGGVGGTTRLLKNIGGLWLVQECRRVWSLSGDTYDWSELTRMAEQATPLHSVIDPDHPAFLAPKHMAEEIKSFCQRTGQNVPDSPGAVLRCALESLALRYRSVLGWLEELCGNRINTIHIVGGGTQNRLLCQMAANACQRQVVAGPIEATAIGNLSMQAIALGSLGSISQARQLISSSFQSEVYEPQDAADWDHQYSNFQRVSEAN